MNADPLATQTPMLGKRSGGLLAQRLRSKGWSIRDAAQYLGVSRQRLYTVFDDPGRARLWECAIAGIPQCTPEIKAQLYAVRKAKPKPLPRASEPRPEFEIGDKVQAIAFSDIAEEDQYAVIVRLRGSKKTEDLAILVQGPGGEGWYPEKDFHAYFATTGVNIHRQ